MPTLSPSTISTVDRLTSSAKRRWRLSPDAAADLKQDLYTIALQILATTDPQTLPCSLESRIASRLSFDVSSILRRESRRPLSVYTAPPSDLDLTEGGMGGSSFELEDTILTLLERHPTTEVKFLTRVLDQKRRGEGRVNLRKLARGCDVPVSRACALWSDFKTRLAQALEVG